MSRAINADCRIGLMEIATCVKVDHTHARARLAPQISKWDLARSRVFSQVKKFILILARANFERTCSFKMHLVVTQLARPFVCAKCIFNIFESDLIRETTVSVLTVVN